MEAINKTQQLKALLVILSTAFIQACSTPKTVTPLPAPDEIQPIPFLNKTETVTQTQPHAIRMIIPPQGAYAYFYAGVLIELEKTSLELHSIQAAGYGALIAALYLSSMNANEFEWRMTKLDIAEMDRILKDPNISKLNIEKLRKLVEESIQNESTSKAQKLLVAGLDSNGIFNNNLKGDRIDVIVNSIMATERAEYQPPNQFFEPIVEVETVVATSDKLISINGATRVGRLRMNLFGLTASDFKKRSSIIYRGKKAMKIYSQGLKQDQNISDGEQSD